MTVGPKHASSRLIAQRAGLVFVAVYCAAICAIVAFRARSTDRELATLDFRDFWLTAREFRVTGQIRDDLGVHNYPPIFTILIVPFGVLPLQPAAVVFTLFSMGVFAWSIRSLDRALDGRARFGLSIALAAAFPYLHATLVLGQVNLIAAAALLAALGALLHARAARCGAMLALATLIKVVPIVLIGFVLLRGRLIAAIVALICVASLGIALPAALLGVAETQRQYQGFVDRAAAGHSAYSTIQAEKPQKAKYSNIALPMVLRRVLTGLDAAPGTDRAPLLVNIVDWPSERVWSVYLLLAFLFFVATVGTTIYCTWIRRNAGTQVTLLLFGAWSAIALIASPLVWTHHLAMAVPALFAVAYFAIPSQVRIANERVEVDPTARSIARSALGFWFVSVATLISPAARAIGGPLWGVVVLYMACLLLAIRSASCGAANSSATGIHPLYSRDGA